jgi:DNA-binding response OmpR family regulator
MDNHRGFILCVDDHEGVCSFIASVLRKLGYEVVTAYTFADGLFKVVVMNFDLCIINSGLPDTTGAELCKQIRLGYPFAPIIFTSADDSNLQLVEAINAGATYFLTKPFQHGELENTVTQLLC